MSSFKWPPEGSGSGGAGTVTSISGTDPIVVTPDPLTTAGTISLALVTDSSLTGDGSIANPLSVSGLNLDYAINVKLATQVALPANTYNNGAIGVGATLTGNSVGALPSIDGVVPINGDLILVKDEVSQISNGVYTVTNAGSGGAAYILTRTTNSDTSSEFNSQVVIPSAGTVSKGLIYAQQTAFPVIGTDPIDYLLVSGVYVTQETLGTQASGQIPYWNSVDRQLVKGSSDLFYDAVNEQFQVGNTPTETWGTTANHSIFLNDGIVAFQEVNNTNVTTARVLALGRGAIANGIAAIHTLVETPTTVTDVLGIGIDQTITNISSRVLALGSGITVDGDDNVIQGFNSSVTGSTNYLIGNSSTVTGSFNFLGGSYNSVTNGQYNVNLGIINLIQGASIAGANQNVAIGSFLSIIGDYQGVVALGVGINEGYGINRGNIFIGGGAKSSGTGLGDASVIDVYFGGGENATVVNPLVHLRSTDGLLGGPNLDATGWNFHQGVPTGSGVVEGYKWWTPDQGSAPTANDRQLETVKMELAINGAFTLNNYGGGFFTGTPAYSLTVDANGNIIESALAGTGTVTSVDVATANGVSATGGPITTAGSFTFSLGAITPTSVAAVGTVTGSNLAGTNTGDQTITLTGDVTGTGTGSFAATIANDAVTFAKFQNITTARLLGRATAGSGDMEEITLGTNLSFTGTTLNATGGGTPGGSNTQIQYNNAGAFGGIPGFIYNGSAIEANDNIFRIVDEIDGTKKMNWSIAGISAATTRTITAVDYSGNSVLSNGALTATRIPYMTAAGLVDSANLIWDNTNSKLNLLSAGTAALPTLGIGGTTTGLRLNGTALSFSISGVEKVTFTAAGAITLSNPANTFQYQITPAAIVANRILNLPLTTATDTLACLGLAQTFSANQTFSGDIIKSGSIFVVGGNGASCNRLTTGLYTTNGPSYKLTNAGGAVTPYFLGTSSASTGGVLSYIMDGTNGLMLGHGNGTTQIAGAAFKLTNLDNTAGSEDSDLSVYTQAAGATLAERFVFTNDGRIYAKGIHNNAGAVTGATNQYIASGTYTPTLTNTTNISASTPRLCSWIRVGNVVTVGGQLDIDPTALGDTLLGISLPIASALTTAYQLGGSGSSTAIVNESYGIEADAANDRASMKNKAVDLTNHTVAFTFTYEVL